MSVAISMPAAGNLVKWHRSLGDRVEAGDLLCEVETDKTVMEVLADSSGFIQKIFVQEGATSVAADAPLAVICSEAILEETAVVRPQPDAAPMELISKEPPAVVEQLNRGGRVFASPLARRLAKEEGLDLSRLVGSGPGGRIVERDVVSAFTPRRAQPTGDIGRQPERASMRPQEDREADPGFEAIPLDNMRKTIAERLLEAKRTIPHFYLTVDVRLDAVIELRKRLNDQAPKDGGDTPRFKLTMNDFVVKALAIALQQVREANAVWHGDRIMRFEVVDVGVAVAVDGGLFTPIVRKADQKSLSTISNEIKALAAQARNRRLQPSQYQGGVSTVSNLGMFGVKEFAAIINPPQSSILAIGASEERVLAVQGAQTIATMMSATLSCDHRVIDGALGAKLLSSLKALLESPMNLLV